MSRRAHRIALVLIAAGTLVVGLWASVLPRSFYDDFPGLGRVWVAVDGPYNEHLVRDVGGLNLGLALVALVALVTGSALVGRTAGGAALVYGLPHLLYHATHLDPFDAGEAAAVVVALVIAVAAALLAALPVRDPAGPAVSPGTARRRTGRPS